MIRTIATFALLFAYVQARNVTFKDCSQHGKITFVNVIPCDSEPCTFKTGEEVHLNGEFVSTIATSDPILKAEIKMDDTWVAYADINNDACKYTVCPVQVNVPYVFAINTEVFDWPKPFTTEMRFRAFSNDGNTELICGVTTVSVTRD